MRLYTQKSVLHDAVAEIGQVTLVVFDVTVVASCNACLVQNRQKGALQFVYVPSWGAGWRCSCGINK